MTIDWKKTYFVNSLEDYKKQREKKEGLKNLFLEKIGDKNTSDEKMLQNLINVLEKSGIKIKGKPEKKKKRRIINNNLSSKGTLRSPCF